MFNNEGYKIRDQSKPHYVTFTVMDWVDVFTRKRYKDIVVESLMYCQQEKGMVVYGYVIMSNHIHTIIQSEKDDLSGLIRDFKKHTAKRILESIKNEPESRREWMLERFEKAAKKHGRNKKYQFWKCGNHPEEVYSEKFLWSKLDYIHLNPVRAGLVAKASEYVYSSATNYVKDVGVISVTKVDNPVVDVLKKDSFLKSISW
jgi:REP element-mobilizing transposase RayT